MSNGVLDEYLQRVVGAQSPEALESVRVALLGKSGAITELLKSLGQMSDEERKAQGPAIQAMRSSTAEAIAERKTEFDNAALSARLATERLDLTLPTTAALVGTIHPVSQVMDELAEVFADLGFAVATGPEIESEWYNFDALNIPATHPARTMARAWFCAPIPARSRFAR